LGFGIEPEKSRAEDAKANRSHKRNKKDEGQWPVTGCS
jgi:hypothetical protein